LATIPKSLPNQSDGGNRKDFGFPRGSYYEAAIVLPKSTDREVKAHYRLWIPDDVANLRGLIVKQHGCGDLAKATGLDHANDLQWQALASKHQFALLGTKLPDIYPMCTDEAGEDRVTERAFLKALTELAKKSNYPKLDKLPWVLWGHSGGADWAMQMLRYHPERIVSVVNMRCGGILFSSGRSEILELDPKAVPAMLGVPVLWTVGDQDPNVDQCITLIKKIFPKFRKAGASWALAVETSAAHEAGDTRFLAIPYLDAVLTARQANNSHVINLRPIEISQGWLGNTATREVAPVAQYQGNPLEAAWLPNEETARKWQQYLTMSAWNRLRHGACRVGQKLFVFNLIQYPAENCYPTKISPTQKPAAPTNVRVMRTGKAEVVLTWDFVPDLENGLPLFRIYRDNSLIKTLQGQRHNFGDAPEPSQLVLEFRDKDAKQDAVYSVSAFNALGESISQPSQFVIQNHLGKVTTSAIANLQHSTGALAKFSVSFGGVI
jgi:hypothetical protein